MSSRLTNYLEMDGKGRWIIAFGRYKGHFLDDVVSEDKDYLSWLLNNADDLPGDVYDILDLAVG